MTENIQHKVMSLEHMMKQPIGFRYALFCKGTVEDPTSPIPDATECRGHLGDFATYSVARDVAIPHPHDVLIRFYPDPDNRMPSADFMKDQLNQRVERE